MVSLRLFVIILLSLCCREIAGSEPNLTLRTALLTAAGMTLGFGLLVKSFALSVLQRGSLAQPASLQSIFQSRRKFADVAWCCFLPAALLATDWSSWLNLLELRGLPKAFALLGNFMPTVLYVLLSEVTAAQFDEITQQRAGENATPWPAHLRVRLRLGDFAGLMICLAPVMVISSLTELATIVPNYLLAADTTPIWLTVIVAVATLSVFLVAFPGCLSRCMGASSMSPAPVAERINGHLQKLGINGVEPLVIQSNGRWAGAAVVGWLPAFRKLWLGDALIANLSDEELDMVVLHELAHIRRKHFLWRSLPVLGVALLSMLAWVLLQHWIEHESILLAAQLIVMSVTAGALVSTLGAIARLCELDADQCACKFAREHCEWAGTHSPNAVLSEALARLVPDASGNSATTWLHPSLKQRLENLTAAHAPA